MDKYPPTPQEIRAYLADTGLTRREIAELCGVSDRIVGYWQSGQRNMPYSIWFTLRTKLEGKPPC